MSIRANRPFTINTSTIAINRNVHDNKPLLLDVSAGTTVTLPAATGSGAVYHFIVKTASNANVINASTNGADFFGGYLQNDTGDTVASSADFQEAATDNNTYSPTTAGGGGLVGDWFIVTDYATNSYHFFGANKGVTDPTNRFSTV